MNTASPSPAETDFLLPPIQFSRCELGVLLAMAHRCANDPGISREDRSNATLFGHMVRTHFERVLCMNKEELFHLVGGEPECALLAFPENVTRQDVIDGLRELYRLALEAEQSKDPAMVGWPTMTAVLDHLEEHGLAPKEAL